MTNAEAVNENLTAAGLAETPVSSQAPAPAPLGLPGTCALEYLVNAGNFNSLIELVEAASQSAEIARESHLAFTVSLQHSLRHIKKENSALAMACA